MMTGQSPSKTHGFPKPTRMNSPTQYQQVDNPIIVHLKRWHDNAEKEIRLSKAAGTMKHHLADGCNLTWCGTLTIAVHPVSGVNASRTAEFGG